MPTPHIVVVELSAAGTRRGGDDAVIRRKRARERAFGFVGFVVVEVAAQARESLAQFRAQSCNRAMRARERHRGAKACENAHRLAKGSPLYRLEPLSR